METDWRIERLKEDIEVISVTIASIQQMIKTQKLPTLEFIETKNIDTNKKVWTQETFFEHIILMYEKRIDYHQIEKNKLINRIEEIEKENSLRILRLSANKQHLIENPKLLWTKKDFDREKGIDVDSVSYGNNFREMINLSLEEDRIAQRDWYEDGGGGDEWSSEP